MFAVEATVFVYEHTDSGEIKAEFFDGAVSFAKSPEWRHVGTVEPRAWIASNWKSAQQGDGNGNRVE